LLTNLTTFFKSLNPSNLSGSIDIIVVQQHDGSYRSTPFHVRFGKIHLFLNPFSKKVLIHVYGELVGTEMTLGSSGEALFMRKLDENAFIPTSEELELMRLKRGANAISFSVEGNVVTSSLFLWDKNEKVVISDIDGTITKSDVLGHILPVLGEDWSHSGVAELYTNIQKNGYQILYLTARAIGQSGTTRNFLDKVVQSASHKSEITLPKGPVFMSPDRVFDSLMREVILRCPEQFKVACLKEIGSLFTASPCFYAGFGNRSSDLKSYIDVGIPCSKIFIINEHGEINEHVEINDTEPVLNMSITFTYPSLNEIVDAMFPPFIPGKQVIEDKYNEWKYWKPNNFLGGSLAEIEAELFLNTK